ncbi:BatA domain-containing protein, partial [Oceaniradius stylonematis]
MIGAIGFTFPAVLAALALLPLIWWLLRLIPPRPQTELFPPLRILARLVKKEETPAKSPWWLTALRLGLTALVILALARPILNPQSELASGDGPLLILIDNDWSAAPDWDDRVRTAQALIAQAGDQGRPVALAPTVAGPAATVQLTDAGAAADMLGAIQPIAGRAERDATLARLLAATETADAPPVLAMIDTGLAEPDGEALNDRLAGAGLSGLLRFTATDRDLVAITAADNRTDGFALSLARTPAAAETASVALYDSRERLLGRGETTFEAGAAETIITFDIPFELRNDIATARIDDAPHAGAAFLLDENNRRRRVALLTGLAGDEAQPLLSPLFYISRALAPFADLIEPRTGDLSVDVPEMIDQGPAMIVMADIGVLPAAAADRIDEWLAAGGTLVRFAGPRLAASAQDDPYLPVTLRAGERALGGALSWSEPQAVAAFAAESPFAGLEAPRDVTVTRQILAQPDADLADRTWASLADGTPLVTGVRRGEGAIVLFHVTAEATWSNLPISGTFVDMLRRITDFARNTEPGQAPVTAAAESTAALPPLRILRADGTLAIPPAHVRPLDAEADARPGFENPAGLYGTPEGFVARNVLARDETLTAFAPAPPGLDVAEQSLVAEDEADLSGWLFLAAFVLLIADTLAVLWINGRLSFGTAPRRRAPASAAIALAAGLVVIFGA